MFIEKLNRKQQGVYVIEEEKIIVDGIWEGFLDHDNANTQSIYIYTAPKFTGQKVDNYFISTPSETPWKTSVKVFSDKEKVYITYETAGDQIEAEDINILQEAVEITKSDFSSYRINNNVEVSNLKSRATSLENTRADKTYVDTEFLKKADKTNTYTKQEVLAEIEKVIDAAPDALNTLKEIAVALNNDPSFAATMTNELAKKVDKAVGKVLSDENYTLIEKQKLAGVAMSANNYVHPANHTATVITESTTKRFVSDLEKADWSAKETVQGSQEKATTAETNSKAYTDTHDSNTTKHITATERTNWDDSNSNKHTHLNKTVLDSITQALVDGWSSAVTHITDAIKHITAGERTKWNTVDNKVDKITGKQLSTEDYTTTEKAKLSGVATGANNYAHPDNATTRHVTDTEKTTWNGKANVSQIPTKTSQLANDSSFVTQLDLGNAGYGDMVKSVYDTNDNGKVDSAENADSVPWTGVTGKPSTFIPTAHNHTKAQVTDFPAIPTKTSELTNDSNFLVKGATWNALKGV